MYFASRLQAGRMLATQLAVKYRDRECAVVALNDGGVVVGAQIAHELHCVLTMLLSAEIDLPHENMSIGGISIDGQFSYSEELSSGEIEDMASEYRGFIEQEKLIKMSEMNTRLGKTELINRALMKGHDIILVSDGMKTTASLNIALEFLKPIAIGNLIVALPLASLKVVDRIHITADEIYCLSVIEDYTDTDHYYDTQDVPDHQTAIDTVEKAILDWTSKTESDTSTT